MKTSNPSPDSASVLYGTYPFCVSLQALWLEYMDYAKVREDQQTAVLEWEMTHFRTEEHRVKIPVLAGSEDVSEPNERLLKRSVSSLSCHRKVYND